MHSHHMKISKYTILHIRNQYSTAYIFLKNIISLYIDKIAHPFISLRKISSQVIANLIIMQTMLLLQNIYGFRNFQTSFFMKIIRFISSENHK